MRSICLALGLAVASFACGGSDKSDDNGSSNGSCDLKSSYDGAIGKQDFSYNADNGAYEYIGELSASSNDKEHAYVFIQLFSGFGVFKDGLKTGQFSITGDDANYQTCGLCVSVLGVTDNDSDPVVQYAATGGSVTITTLNDTFTAAVRNVTLTHIDVDNATGAVTVNSDKCETSVASASVSATAVAEPLVCQASGTYDGTYSSAAGAFVLKDGGYTFSSPAFNFDTGSATLHAFLDILAIPGKGAFANTTVKSGSYTLSADDLYAKTCGLCVFVTAYDTRGTVDDESDDLSTLYLATAGTINLTTVNSTTFAGTLANFTLQHVTLGAAGSTPAPDASTCTVGIASSSFSGTVATN